MKIVKIACGATHTAVINEKGEVYTWGNNDSGALGRENVEDGIPGKVQLPY